MAVGVERAWNQQAQGAKAFRSRKNRVFEMLSSWFAAFRKNVNSSNPNDLKENGYH